MTIHKLYNDFNEKVLMRNDEIGNLEKYTYIYTLNVV